MPLRHAIRTTRCLVHSDIAQALSHHGSINYDWLLDIVPEHCPGGVEAVDEIELRLQQTRLAFVDNATPAFGSSAGGPGVDAGAVKTRIEPVALPARKRRRWQRHVSLGGDWRVAPVTHDVISIKHHHLVPRRDEVPDEARMAIAAGIDIGDSTQL